MNGNTVKQTKPKRIKPTTSGPYSREYEVVFEQTMPAYVEAKERLGSSILQASNPDDDAQRATNPFLLAEYVADCEGCFQAACGDNLSLQEGLLALVNEYAELGKARISAGLKNDVIYAVGRLLTIRGMEPRKYFRKIKRRN